MKGAGWEGGSYPTLSPSFMWVLPEPSNDPAPRNAGDQGSPGGHNYTGQPREHRVGSKRREGILLRSTEGWTKAPPATQAAHWGPDIWENDPSLATRKEGMGKEILKEVLRESKPHGCWSHGLIPPTLSQAVLLLWGGTSCCVILAPAPAHAAGVI